MSFLMLLPLPAIAGAQTASNTRAASPQPERLIRQVGDTVFMVKPQRLRFQGDISVSPVRTPNAPDTLKVLLQGDSAVTLNTQTVRFYSREETALLRQMVALQRLVPDSTNRRRR